MPQRKSCSSYRNTFLTSSTIALEAKIAANFAVKKLKLDSLAVLAPADEYGEIQNRFFYKRSRSTWSLYCCNPVVFRRTKKFRRQFKHFRDIAFNLNKKKTILKIF